jgi:hypothetical protein
MYSMLINVEKNSSELWSFMLSLGANVFVWSNTNFHLVLFGQKEK